MLEKNKKTAATTASEADGHTNPTLDLSRTVMEEHFSSKARPWMALDKLAVNIRERGIELPFDRYDEITENVWVHQSVYLSPYVKLTAPVIICGGAKICHYCHIECSVIGSFSQISEFSAVKSSIIFDKVRLFGHNSVNSSILGYECALGEGVTVSDRRIDGLNVSFETSKGVCVTDKRTLGAIICDGAVIGASSVINPGSIIDFNAKILPLSSVSGYVPPYS